MYKQILTILLLIALTHRVTAQPTILDQPITIECRGQQLGHVLKAMAESGNFYFSYAGMPFNKDSLITLPQQTKPVRQLLDELFKGRLQYRENGRYLILLPAADKSTQSDPPPADKRLLISGTILDERTGSALADVSVYDPEQLVVTLSKKDGSFVVRLKNKGWPIILTVSKEAYIDTIIQLQPGSSRELTIGIAPDAFHPKALLFSPGNHWSDDSIHIQWDDSALVSSLATRDLVPGVETTGFARIVLSYRLRVQSINLRKYFVQRPIQLSLVPGLSTNGPMNSQVTNKFSVNLLGGYSAGLDGVELGGVFNIDKKSAIGVQAAGVGNVVGDSVRGIQLAGVFNTDLDSVRGLQAAGVVNTTKHLRGIQLAGVINNAGKVDGFQAAGVLNRTHRLHGVQIGVVNIADTSNGISIGLLNIVKNGIHELSFYADEWSPVNIAFRSGNAKMYGILLAGFTPDNQRRAWYFGYGFGHQFNLAHALGLRPEVSVLNVSPVDLRHFGDNNAVYRLDLDLHWQPARNFGISAGPSITLYSPGNKFAAGSYLYQPLPHGYSRFAVGNGRSIGWIGWRMAVNLF